jgi:hypothetical protein
VKGGKPMEYTLPLSSIIALLVPMPLLVLFSIISLVRQAKETNGKEEAVSSPLNPVVEKRNVL